MATIVETTINSAPDQTAVVATEGTVSEPVQNNVINFSDAAVSTDGLIVKVPTSSLRVAVPINIRPSLRKMPNETPFILEMIDSNFQSYAILLPDGTYITDLKLNPNPDSLIINSAKIINRYNTMTRWVEEHWGDEIDTVSFSGSSFSFTAYNIPNVPNTGLTTKYGEQTPAFKMLKQLSDFIRNNGFIYKDSSLYEEGVGINTPGEELGVDAVDLFLRENPKFVNNHPRRGMIQERLYIKLRFDYVNFIGYFESLDLVESSDNPYRNTYSAVFKSEKTKYLLG